MSSVPVEFLHVSRRCWLLPRPEHRCRNDADRTKIHAVTVERDIRDAPSGISSMLPLELVDRVWRQMAR
jgi:hypothetical protein